MVHCVRGGGERTTKGHMATLTHPNWDTVTPELRSLLSFLGQQSFLDRFYLAGGTALALQLGHRRSIDLDFFTESDEVDSLIRQKIIHALQPIGIQVIENADGNLLLLASGIHVGFFSYHYPLLDEQRITENVNLASLIDIGLMKCDALITRGSRKDFYDLYFLSQVIPLENLLLMAEKKYSYYRDFPLTVIERMVDFDNADRDVQPVLIKEIPWLVVKEFFFVEAGRLGRMWIRP